ncbi:preprotein translocase subunit SecA [Mycoplasma sp. NEAQ87857]|nr:preprotein translocase subunit SecA [Mycoplasma sp. NEAQ87857]
MNFKSTEMRVAEKALKKINKLEKIVSKFSDQQLKDSTTYFKELIAQGHTLEQIREDVFAVAREATKRVLGKRPYDVQMLGGLLLDLGSVAEMKTGEGKTITSIAPVYLNALLGKGAIVSTVNEYLSERDAEEMGQVFNFLGLTVGVNKAQMDPYNKRLAYAADITYSVHSELGFDYLRDNMVQNPSEKVQRGLQFCLIDEVDSILIDEAKTPLIISGGEQEDVSSYFAADQFVRTLGPEDYLIDDESKAITLTHAGIAKANHFYKFNSLYDIENSETVHLIQNALRAHKVMKIDVEYIVREGKIELVDAFTGRIMDGRSYSEGLQQAIQAKEMVEVEPETKTLATITYQNFFRMFKKLCGMTGTGKTEEQEFIDIYNMRVNVVPTNKPVVRVDEPDSVFPTYEDKWNAVADKIAELYQKGQPVLVGTAQIEDSEIIHRILLNRGIPHTVLNAKQNASEAEIISQAGQVKAVTIATNMAGRGTDIKPSEEAIKLGGLYVLGTDKAESRRIDNQLRGRSGRQGDVGTSKFFVSIDDQLMQRFSNYEANKQMYAADKGKEITNKQLRFFFNQAQKKIEGFNYDSRKSVLNYDDVIRQQRDLIYSQRDLILESTNVDYIVQRMISSSARSIVRSGEYYLHNKVYNYEALVDFLNQNIGNLVGFEFHLNEINKIHEADLPEYISNVIITVYSHWYENAINNGSIDEVEILQKRVILQTLDEKWQKHINKMDKLRSNVNLVQYSQKNPYQIYTDEGTKMFERMLDSIAYGVMLRIFSNRMGKKSLITKEIRADQLFNQILSSYQFDPTLPLEEQEQSLLDLYNSIKRRMNEIEQETQAELDNNSNAEAQIEETLNNTITNEAVEELPLNNESNNDAIYNDQIDQQIIENQEHKENSTNDTELLWDESQELHTYTPLDQVTSMFNRIIQSVIQPTPVENQATSETTQPIEEVTNKQTNAPAENTQTIIDEAKEINETVENEVSSETTQPIEEVTNKQTNAPVENTQTANETKEINEILENEASITEDNNVDNQVLDVVESTEIIEKPVAKKRGRPKKSITKEQDLKQEEAKTEEVVKEDKQKEVIIEPQEPIKAVAKKRGRPKKQETTNETKVVESTTEVIEEQNDQEKVVVLTSKKRGRPKKKLEVEAQEKAVEIKDNTTIEKEALKEEKQKEVVAESQEPIKPAPKKRGRPKKQVTNDLVVESTPKNKTTKKSSSKTSKDKKVEEIKEDNHTLSAPKKRGRPKKKLDI